MGDKGMIDVNIGHPPFFETFIHPGEKEDELERVK
jgi:hypothetical protein